MASNCLFFAWAIYRRRRKKGKLGYVLLRKSHWGRFPHFLYVERRERTFSWRVVSYVPSDPQHKACPPPLFRGRVRWGDMPKDRADV